MNTEIEFASKHPMLYMIFGVSGLLLLVIAAMLLLCVISK